MFPALLARLRRQYPEVYGLVVDTARAHERRELILVWGGGLSGSTSLNISLKLGAYAGRLASLHLTGNINPSPNLTTVYLDTPLVGHTPEPLKYVHLPGRLGQPSRYPQSSAGGGPYTGGSKRGPPPPPPPYSTHPRMNPPTGRAQPHMVIHATHQNQSSKILAPRGEPLANFWPQGPGAKASVREILNAPSLLLFLASKQRKTLGGLHKGVKHPAAALIRKYVEEGIPAHTAPFGVLRPWRLPSPRGPMHQPAPRR